MDQSSIKHFACESIDKALIALEWRKWIRSVKLYLDAEEITDVVKMKNKLLHLGGPQLQEIAFGLPGAVTEYDPTIKNDIFKALVDRLNDRFSPQQTPCFERHVFRNMKPVDGENLNRYLIRCRPQADKCYFGHFARRCRTGKLKRTFVQNTTCHPNPPKTRRINCIDESNNESLPSTSGIGNYECFEVTSSTLLGLDSSNGIISVIIGGVSIDILIDSGASCNITNGRDWEKLLGNGAAILDIQEDITNTIKAYAANTPLINLTGTTSLLGRRTSITLGVLKLGLDSNINHIGKIEPFPKVANIKIKLTINPNIKPIQQPVRRIPIAVEEKVEQKLNEALARDIIEPVQGPSPWISPMVIFFKPDDDIRICIDMRRANEAILRENFPLPTFESFMTKLSGATYFSRLDLASAYPQLELEENSRPITTFIKHKGLFRYKRLMFSINSAPEIFQRIFQGILAPCQSCLNYLDDIVVYGETEADHDRYLNNLLTVLRNHNILLNEKKCQYKIKQLEFLGHILTSIRILQDPKKIKVIRNFSAPLNKGEVIINSKVDPEIPEVIEKLAGNSWNLNDKSAYYSFRMELTSMGPLLLRGNKIVIPRNLRIQVLRLAHEGHPRASVMNRRLRSKVWWPQIDKEAEKYVKSCRECLLVSKPSRPSPMVRQMLPSGPWQYLAIDYMSGDPNQDNLLVIIDYYSRYVEPIFTKSTTSSTVIRALETTFCRFGLPKTIKVDNATNFNSEEFKKFCEINGIEIVNSPPYWPQANGEVETINKSLKKRLQISYLNNERDYQRQIMDYITMYNVTPHGTTGKSPSELLFNRRIKDNIPCLEDINIETLDEEVYDQDLVQKDKGKRREDSRRRANEKKIKPGDKVVV
ncbi:uncharacterized protein K02A2.6-like [Sitophilus oryzae]|uniref:RNA-directed DNA polymerase n=1 Tax=Sitophilus oryzae TaxID=7048 RepID=A0A6J2YMQ5_SITOR|nr:uncharacterized protein K02A2.6-like [Sitophilus oryzae]